MKCFARIATQCTFRPRPSKFFPKEPALKKFLIFSQNKAFFIFSQNNSPHFQASAPKFFFLKKFLILFPKRAALKKFLIFSQKKPLIFRKGNFLIFRERNPSIFRTNSIFRTLTYLEPWHIQNHGIFRTLSNIYNGTFCKNSYLEHLKKILIFSGNRTFYLQY